MADKEIIIDGVNVAGCISFEENLKICCYEDIREDKIPFVNFCCENKDCYYKQLQRKEQECKKLKEKLDNIQDDCPSFGDCSYVQCAKDERDRYRQALEKIEELATNGYLKDSRFCEAKELQQILIIINEVKE